MGASYLEEHTISCSNIVCYIFLVVLPGLSNLHILYLSQYLSKLSMLYKERGGSWSDLYSMFTLGELAFLQ